MAIYSVVMSVGFMVAFPAVGAIVQAGGWRTAWLSIGVALVAGLAPAGWLLVPSAVGRGRDGHRDRAVLAGYPLTAALATPAFWVFAVGTALYGLVASGIGLFNESILHERGFSAAVYYQTLVVTAMTALAGNFAGGWLAERVPLGRLMAASLAVLSAGLAGLPYVRSLTGVIVWAAAMGIGGGLVMVLFFSVWSRVFGRRALGRIQGAAQALTVLASATGPILLAWCVESTGSYARMFQILAVVVGVVAVTSLVVPLPPARE
jgi:MFS family permease